MEVHSDLGWELSQALCFYVQMYVVPLVLMCILSALTVYRREMSCNRVYALQSEDAMVSPPRHPGNQPPHQQPQDSDRSSPTGRSAPLMASLLAARSRGQLDTGSIQEEEQTPLRQVAAPTDSRSQRDDDVFSGGASGLMSCDWSRHAKDAIGFIASSLPRVARTRFAESSFVFFPINRRRQHTKDVAPLHPDRFPADVLVNVFSFFHPKDVALFACVSRACRDIVDGEGTTTLAIWKTLWQRDYGWLMQSWQIGREVLSRSNVTDPLFGKDFYFRFGLSHVNYLLAGLNSQDCCFVGLHGNIYDITTFVTSHPGSPDTLLVHAGRDATKLFDDMDHSRRARRLARGFCIAVDTSYAGSYGSKPTAAFPADRPAPAIVEPNQVFTKKKRRLQRRECLKQCYEAFVEEEIEHRKSFNVTMKAHCDVLHWNMFYDPFQGAWRVWYTNKDFETVFV